MTKSCGHPLIEKMSEAEAKLLATGLLSILCVNPILASLAATETSKRLYTEGRPATRAATEFTLDWIVRNAEASAELARTMPRSGEQN